MSNSTASFGDIYHTTHEPSTVSAEDISSMNIATLDTLDGDYVNVLTPQSPCTSLQLKASKEVICGPDAPTYEGKVKWFESVLLSDQDDSLLSYEMAGMALGVGGSASSTPAGAGTGTGLDRQVLSDYIMKHGVPDRPQLRSLAWKLLLGYLPFDKSEWLPTLTRNREIYGVWLKEFIVNPYDDIIPKRDGPGTNPNAKPSNSSTTTPSSTAQTPLSKEPLSAQSSNSNIVRVAPQDDPLATFTTKRTAVGLHDDPLSPMGSSKTSGSSRADRAAAAGDDETSQSTTTTEADNAKNKWLEYYKDEEIRAEVDKDVQRTYSSLHFFQLPVHPDDVMVTTTTSPAHAVSPSDKHKVSSPSPSSSQDEYAPSGGPSSGLLPADASGNGGAAAETPNQVKRRQRAKFDDDDDDINQGLFGEYNPNRLQVNDMGTIRVQEVVESTIRPLCHHDVLRRLLFLYAKLNPGVRYVQGMNEILAPIYYIFASDPDSLTVNYGQSFTSKQGKTSPLSTSQQFSDAEADAFFCFSNLMAHIRDRFIKSLDHAENGVMTIISRYDQTLSELDHELWCHFKEQDLDPRFYSFRWLTLLLSQDFQLPDVLRLWDSIFADDMTDVNLIPTSLGQDLMPVSPPPVSPRGKRGAAAAASTTISPTNRSNIRFDIYLCCAMVISLRDQLLESEFTEILSVLQQYPATDVEHLLVVANELRRAHQSGTPSRYVGHAPPRQSGNNNTPSLQHHASHNSSASNTSRVSTSTHSHSSHHRADIPLGSAASSRPTTSRTNSTGNSITNFFRNAFN